MQLLYLYGELTAIVNMSTAIIHDQHARTTTPFSTAMSSTYRNAKLGLHHLSLLRDPEVALHTARRLTLDGKVSGAAATPHCAAPAMEQVQLDASSLGDRHQ